MLPDGVLLVPYELQLAENRRKLEQATTSRDEGIVDKVGSFVKGAVNRTSFDAAERGEGPGVVDRKGKGKEMHTQEAVEQIWLHCSVGDVIEDEEVTTELPTVSSDSPHLPLLVEKDSLSLHRRDRSRTSSRPRLCKGSTGCEKPGSRKKRLKT